MKIDFTKIQAIACLILTGAIPFSCINQEYDLTQINKEITVGGDSLALPLGTTEQLKLKSLVADLDDEILQTIEGGVYALRLNDKVNLDDQMPDLSSMLNIPDVAVNETIPVETDQISEDDYSMAGSSYSKTFSFDTQDLTADIKVPEITESRKYQTGIWEYAGEASNFELDLPSMNSNTGTLFTVPDWAKLIGGEDDKVISLSELNGKYCNIPSVSNTVVISASMSENVSNISEIILTDNSRVRISITTENSFLTQGSFVPDLTLDLSSILRFDDGTGILHLNKDNFVLDQNNGYSSTSEFYLSSVNIDPSEWINGKLSVSRQVELSGSIGISGNPSTTVGTLKNYSGGVSFDIRIEYIDTAIGSITMDIKNISINENGSSPVTVEDISMPEGVNSIEKIYFTRSSAINISIKPENLDIPGLDMTLDKLTLTFPEELEVEGAADGSITYSGVDISKGFSTDVIVKSFTPPASANGIISYNGEIGIQTDITAGGRIKTSDLPVTQGDDGAFAVNVTSSLGIDDYVLDIDRLSRDIEMEPSTMRFDFDFKSDMGTIKAVPAGNPELTIDISMPESSLNFSTGSNGVTFSLPEFIKFKETYSPDFSLDTKSGTVFMTGNIPERISLPVDYFIIDPVFDETSGKYYISGEIKATGSIGIGSGQVSGKDLESLAGSEASITATVPDITVSEISFDEFSIDMTQEKTVTIMKAEDFPEELLSITDIEMDNVRADIGIGISGLPDLGTDINLDLAVRLPEEIVLDESDSRVQDGILKIQGVLRDGKIAIDPIGVSEIMLSDFDFSKKEDLTGNISVEGKAYAVNPTVNLSEIAAADMEAAINISIADIRIKKITGKVDYKIEGMEENIKLDDLPDFMKGEDFTLDFTDPHLILSVKTNAGIPLDGTMSITPYFNGAGDNSKSIEFMLSIPGSPSAQETVTTTFWIGKNREGCPNDYTFVQADLNKLISKIPDEIRFTMNASTDTETDCIVEPMETYTLSVDYDFVVPMSFGEDLDISLSDTLENMPDIVGQMLKKGEVMIFGSVTSSLPLQMNMVITPLDGDNNIIMLGETASQTINACNSDGSAATTPLRIKIVPADREKIGDLKKLKLDFSATSGNSAGIPITEESYVQAEIKIMVPGGITLDLDEMMSNDENNQN